MLDSVAIKFAFVRRSLRLTSPLRRPLLRCSCPSTVCGHFVGLKFTPRRRSRPPSGPNTRVAARHPCHNAYVRVYCLLRGAKKISRQTECERFLSLKHLAPPRTPSLPLPALVARPICVACMAVAATVKCRWCGGASVYMPAVALLLLCVRQIFVRT